MMDSSKIKKDIRSIIFASEKKTIITYKSNFTPNQHNQAVSEIKTHKSDMARHDHFNEAMKVFAVHLMIRSQFMEHIDRLGMSIEAPYFTDHIYLDDPRLEGIKVKGIIFTTKDDTTSFQIVGYKITKDGEIIQLKSPVISTIKLQEGENVYNYPLITFADEHKETLLLEAAEFLNYKSNALTLFSSATVHKMTPKQQEEANREEKAKAAGA